MIVKPICSRAFQSRFQRRFAALDVTADVLDDHDRVIDHETGGDGQRHQRQVVDAETGQIHHRESAHQRQRHRDARNDRGRDIAQEQENHHDHQRDRQQQLELHVMHRGAYGHGAVGQRQHLDIQRQ